MLASLPRRPRRLYRALIAFFIILKETVVIIFAFAPSRVPFPLLSYLVDGILRKFLFARIILYFSPAGILYLVTTAFRGK